MLSDSTQNKFIKFNYGKRLKYIKLFKRRFY